MTFVNRQYLVETDWLAEHLDDPDLRIVDCTQYLPGYADEVAITTVSGRENYAEGHIPGAAYVDLLGELSDRTRTGIYAPMPPAEQFAAVMSRIGVGDGTRVVLYDDFLGMYAARIWWMLRAFGFDDAAVLNGGWQKWRREGRPVSTEPATYPPATFVPRPRPERSPAKRTSWPRLATRTSPSSMRCWSRNTRAIPASRTTTADLVTSRQRERALRQRGGHGRRHPVRPETSCASASPMPVPWTASG